MNERPAALPLVTPAPLSNVRVIANVVLFQIGWFACVLSAAQGMSVVGTALATLIVLGHITRAPRPTQELQLVLAAVLIGAVWDSALVACGLLVFPAGTLLRGAAPHWIFAMWALFATTLNVSLNWLKGRWLLAALLGAVAGPLAYWAAVRLGAVVFGSSAQIAVATLGIGWAVLLPVLMLLAARHNGFAAGVRG